ncbi:MAG: DUF485 domain-containing protein [Streptomycetaceae bacterium]|nr:DUF485 domain-containing protein [Streptomycetaceae bacterium]
MTTTPPSHGSPADDAGGPPSPAPPPSEWHADVQASDGFRRLRFSFRMFAFPVTVAFCAWYLLYVLLAVYAKDFMGTKVFGNVNLGFVFGVLQFVTTFLIAWAYARYARTRIDPAAAAVRARLEETVAAGDAR